MNGDVSTQASSSRAPAPTFTGVEATAINPVSPTATVVRRTAPSATVRVAPCPLPLAGLRAKASVSPSPDPPIRSVCGPDSSQRWTPSVVASEGRGARPISRPPSGTGREISRAAPSAASRGLPGAARKAAGEAPAAAVTAWLEETTAKAASGAAARACWIISAALRDWAVAARTAAWTGAIRVSVSRASMRASRSTAAMRRASASCPGRAISRANRST